MGFFGRGESLFNAHLIIFWKKAHGKKVLVPFRGKQQKRGSEDAVQGAVEKKKPELALGKGGGRSSFVVEKN